MVALVGLVFGVWVGGVVAAPHDGGDSVRGGAWCWGWVVWGVWGVWGTKGWVRGGIALLLGWRCPTRRPACCGGGGGLRVRRGWRVEVENSV